MNTHKLYWVKLLMSFLPETRCFGFKRRLYKWAGVNVGENVRICSSARFMGAGQLTIGDNTWIGPHCLLSVSSSAVIGGHCNLAPRVMLLTGTHEIDLQGESVAGRGRNEDIEIGAGSWICAGAIVLGGTVIGRKSILAAGSVAKGMHNDFEMLAGSLAQVVKKLNNE